MAVTTEKLEASLELVLVALGQVCQTGTNEEKIAASRELVHAVEMASTQLRKAMLTKRVLQCRRPFLFLLAVSRKLGRL